MSFIPDDKAFLALAFRTKYQSGWLSFLGDSDNSSLRERIGIVWKFGCFEGPDHLISLYALLNMLARYTFVYGRIEPGDTHSLVHFIEDFAPGVIVCAGELTDLEPTVLLAAMKFGVPAIVGTEFPFQLGRRIVASTDAQIVENLTRFSNTHRRTDHIGIPNSLLKPEKKRPKMN